MRTPHTKVRGGGMRGESYGVRLPPLLRNKFHKRAAVFTPENLLREARRQKGIPKGKVPEICVLDPDGDLVRYLRRTEAAKLSTVWACYHTELYEFGASGARLGVVGCAVGAPFAVLLAEELFACGCKLVVSVTSAGQIVAARPPPYFVLVTRALRDEGTSYHYLPAGDYAEIRPGILALARRAFSGCGVAVEEGIVWTTDAPFRETREAIALAKKERLLAVEMESAALYAFAAARRWPVLCLAHGFGPARGPVPKRRAGVQRVTILWRRGLGTARVSSGRDFAGGNGANGGEPRIDADNR